MSDFLHSWNEKSGRIIVFAGIFDPVHNGHIAVAKEAEKRHGEHVVILPERVPWHKHGETAYEHRLEMLKIATDDHPDLSVLDYDADKHHVVETFKWLKEQYPDRPFAWLVGSDVAGNIEKWPGSEKLPELHVNLIIVAKRVHTPYDIRVGRHIAGVPTAYIPSEHRHLSSAFVRADMEDRNDNLPAGVYHYIKQHKLYKR